MRHAAGMWEVGLGDGGGEGGVVVIIIAVVVSAVAVVISEESCCVSLRVKNMNKNKPKKIQRKMT